MRAIHIILNILIAVGVALTLLTVGVLYIGLLQGGFEGEGGMAILALMLYGVIFAATTFTLSASGYVIARNIDAPSNRIIRTGLTVSVIAVLSLVLVNLF